MTPPITATFNLGALTVIGDSGNNVIAVSRDAAGTILVNAGAVPVAGGPATVANTRSINVVGAAGNDRITVDESSGALPRAFLVGGEGNDTLTGGSGDDIIVGQAGTDTLLGKGGTDTLFGGADNDTLTGGDANDQVSGEDGSDTLVWNPGDDTDVNEGGAGQDTTLVLGGNGDEQFTAVPNGTRVRIRAHRPRTVHHRHRKRRGARRRRERGRRYLHRLERPRDAHHALRRRRPRQRHDPGQRRQ